VPFHTFTGLGRIFQLEGAGTSVVSSVSSAAAPGTINAGI
jgi:hypothetical protein